MVVYGIHAVAEALRAKRIGRLFVADRTDARVAALLDQAAEAGVAIERVSRDRLDRDARGGSHQGVVATVSPPPPVTLDELASTAEGPPLIVVFDEIEDPQNAGAIIRTVDASGASGVVRQTRRSAALDGAVAKASAGALAHVRIADVVNIARALDDLKRAGVWTLGLDAGAEMPYYQWDFTLPTAVVLGAEGRGLRRLVRERCDGVAGIPMRGHVGSLNVSAAAAIVLFEAVRQRSRRRP